MIDKEIIIAGLLKEGIEFILNFLFREFKLDYLFYVFNFNIIFLY